MADNTQDKDTTAQANADGQAPSNPTSAAGTGDAGSGQPAAETPHGAQPDQPGLTFGEKAVGKSFNPSQNPQVDNLKDLAAAFIDAVNNLRAKSEDGEVKRMASVAITDAQSAQMWAVKAATWQ